MKYGSLNSQGVKSFKTGALDGGLKSVGGADLIKDNEIVSGCNMWYKDSYLKTRPGFKNYIDKAVNTFIYGNDGQLKYNVTNTSVYLDGVYWRIATAEVLTDDYAYYVYSYLIDLEGNIAPMGYISFNRSSSNSFYIPVHINFFNGKAQNGGGIFAIVALQDKYNWSKKSYCIYEVNSDYSGWKRVNDFYVPTVLINGRGNKYQTAKAEKGFSSESPLTLESQNMLDGRFHAYYTSDGYSHSFRLPFNSLADETVSCKIYYNISQYIEWTIPPDNIRDIQHFYGKDVSAFVDRDTGILYFTAESGDFPIPIMEMCVENNIKITATKDIDGGIASIANASCVTRYNSKLLVAGGEGGNKVYAADYDNPLYFPKNNSIDIGESGSPVICMSPQQDKIVAFKEHEMHLLTFKEGDVFNEITLLKDNGKVFKKPDSFESHEVSKKIGCANENTVAICGGKNIWLSDDGRIYKFDVTGKKITEICNPIELKLNNDIYSEVTAIGSDEYYIISVFDKMLVIDIQKQEESKSFLWRTPTGLNIDSGFYHSGKYMFLCRGDDSRLAFISYLEGNTDSVIYFGEEDTVMQKNLSIASDFTTKHYCFKEQNSFKNIEGIYFTLSAKGKVKISVNDRYKTELDFGFLNGDYDKCEYKSVRLSPHLYNVNGVDISFNSDKEFSIGEIEIRYRITG